MFSSVRRYVQKNWRNGSADPDQSNRVYTFCPVKSHPICRLRIHAVYLQVADKVQLHVQWSRPTAFPIILHVRPAKT